MCLDPRNTAHRFICLLLAAILIQGDHLDYPVGVEIGWWVIEGQVPVFSDAQDAGHRLAMNLDATELFHGLRVNDGDVVVEPIADV